MWIQLDCTMLEGAEQMNNSLENLSQKDHPSEALS